MGVNVKDVDRGYRQLQRALASMGKGVEVTVGLHAEEGGEPASSGGMSLVEVAELNEFGSPGGLIPPRPAISGWADENEDRVMGDIQDEYRKAIEVRKAGVQRRLSQRAQVYAGEIQQRIADGVPPPNAPRTIAKKGSSTPLIDQGTFRSSILGKAEQK